MNIAIISTRGIPNNYGGFEQFAEYLSVGLVEKGYQVTVYSPHFHPYKESEYKGVKIKHIYSPENWMGSAIGSFFYDFYSLKHALKKEKFDIIYEAGYTSIVPAYLWFNVKKIKEPVFITNMDGLEWKRTKFKKLIRRFIHWEEKTACNYSQYLIADNEGIKEYYKEKYNRESYFFPYGASIHSNYQEKFLDKYNLLKNAYLLVIARLEPENNIEMIIKGYLNSNSPNPLIIVGKTNTPHGKELVKKYGANKQIRFLGGIYNFDEINSIRYYSQAYFHGHSVGGTNPSLLEAMGSSCFIISNNNIFNNSVLKENALYFSTISDVTAIIDSENFTNQNLRDKFVAQNIDLIRSKYSWEKIINDYESFFCQIIRKKVNS